jgi:membrane associated rhomboid family serine protease
MKTCYRHPNRETSVSCSRCDRPICPECMTPSPVGMRCPECAADSTTVRRPSGGSLVGGVARATYALIGINVLIFIGQLGAGGGVAGFDGGGGLFTDGALCANAVGGGGICGSSLIEDGGEWWRILTAGFLHGGILHLGLNMFVLYILGTLLEPAIGTPRFVAIYFVSLIAGSLGALLLAEPFQNTVGASGAIYGLFAATLLIARDRGLDQVVSQLGFWLVLNLVLTFSISGISIGGHLGGLAGGALAALVVLGAERRRTGPPPVGLELGGLGALAVACFVAAVLVAGVQSETTILAPGV